MWNYADPLTSLELLNYYLTLAMSSGRFAYYVIQRNDTTNDSIYFLFCTAQVDLVQSDANISTEQKPVLRLRMSPHNVPDISKVSLSSSFFVLLSL